MRLHHPSWTTHFKPPGFHVSSMFSYFLWSPRKEKWSHSVVSDYWWPHSLPGSSIHGIFQARVLEWAAISFSRVSSWPRDWTWVSYIAGRRLTIWAPREAPAKMSTIKDRNGMELEEAEHTKKRWREYTEELDAWLKQRPRSRFCREEGWGVDTAAADWAGVTRVPAMCRRQGAHEHRVSSPRK